MMNAQPLPLLVLGSEPPLPTTAGLPCDDEPGEPPVSVLGDELTGMAVGGWDATVVALEDAGAGTDETCEACET